MVQIVRPVVLLIALAVAPTPTRAAPADVSSRQITQAHDGSGALDHLEVPR